MNIQTHSCGACGAPLNLADLSAEADAFSCDHCGAVATLLREQRGESAEERTHRELGEIAREYDSHIAARQLAAAPEIAQEKLIFAMIGLAPFVLAPFVLATLLAGLFAFSELWPAAIVIAIPGAAGMAIVARRAFRRRRRRIAPSPDFSKIAVETGNSEQQPR
jgi:hypothetical protein